MQTTPGFVETLPPPPPPRPDRKRLWIGLGLLVVALCLCGLLVGVYIFRQDIPLISSFFPSPTPVGLYYDNPAAGVSLYYPGTWKYTEGGDATSGYTIIFASSSDLLTSLDAPQTGAAMIVWTNVLNVGDVGFTVDATTMGAVLEFLAQSFSSGIGQGQDIKSFNLGGYPAASAVFSLPGVLSDPSVAYFTGVLRAQEVILFVGICPQSEWDQYQPVFDSILSSVHLVIP